MCIAPVRSAMLKENGGISSFFNTRHNQGAAGQDPQKLKLAAAHRAKASVSSKHRKMLTLAAKRLLASAGPFWQISRTERNTFFTDPGAVPPPWPRQYFPQH